MSIFQGVTEEKRASSTCQNLAKKEGRKKGGEGTKRSLGEGGAGPAGAPSVVRPSVGQELSCVFASLERKFRRKEGGKEGNE